MFLPVASIVAAPAVKLAPVPVMLVPTSASGVPSHELPEMVSKVVLEFAKLFKLVHVLTSTRSVEEAVLPLLPPTQVPLIEKHPPARSMPRANVEVADVPVIFKYVD